jgi:peroxiredoxin Q/BCP
MRLILAGPLALSLMTTACGGSQGPAPDKETQKGPEAVATAKHAPPFSAQDQTGRSAPSEEFKGKHVVLFFYPKDGTPGCTKEACAFRDRMERVRGDGCTQVLGVSMDDVASHKAFADEENLTFPLLADTDGKIAKAYDVSTMLGMAHRTTFIIDKSGIIRADPSRTWTRPCTPRK